MTNDFVKKSKIKGTRPLEANTKSSCRVAVAGIW